MLYDRAKGLPKGSSGIYQKPPGSTPDLQWEATKAEYKASNPPDHMGYWYCVIGGGALTDGKQDALGGLPLNLDHNISRVRDSTRKYDVSNLNPMCPGHNRGKGSRTIEEYRASNPKKRCTI